MAKVMNTQSKGQNSINNACKLLVIITAISYYFLLIPTFVQLYDVTLLHHNVFGCYTIK